MPSPPTISWALTKGTIYDGKCCAFGGAILDGLKDTVPKVPVPDRGTPLRSSGPLVAGVALAAGETYSLCDPALFLPEHYCACCAEARYASLVPSPGALPCRLDVDLFEHKIIINHLAGGTISATEGNYFDPSSIK